MSEVTVARQVLEVLAHHGATTVFGLPGVHNLAFWGADPAPVVVRHEQTAVYAADGWARRSGRLGAAVVTSGPGAANAVAAFGEAAASHSPVVLVASEIPAAAARPGRRRGVLHESRDQSALFAPLAKAVFRPRTPAGAASAIADAAATALRPPRGPVYLDVPADVLGQLAAPGPAGPAPARPAVVSPGVADAVDTLAGRRVVIWAGGAAVDEAAGIEILAGRLGAPLVTSFHARGMPGALGVPPHEPEVAALIGAADVLLVVGGDLDGMNTRNWTMPRPPVLVTVDPAPPADPPEWTADVALTGELSWLVRVLAERVPAHEPWCPADLAARVRAGLDPDALVLLDAVDSRPAGTALVCDMAVAGYWAGGYAHVGEPRGLAYPVGWGTLGFGLPAAVGVASTGVPTLVVCGDGGLVMGLGELATLVQEHLPVTVLVVDDGGYGMLRYDQSRAGAEHRGVDLVTPDFVALARAFGIAATDVPGLAGVGAALRAALATGAPHLVRVPARLTPPRTTSPRWHED
ncbi:MAG: thiamine pyrophosphate-binding protein [Pseudonocardia sp.]|nr:thiamine pyrophosphate-binding protein [Pseudonocardia sp.]